MTNAEQWPVAILTVGASRGGTLLFRKDGKLSLTCVLKCTLRIVPDEPMQLIDPDELFVSELHYRDNPTRSIRATSDIVPYLPRVDVVLTGHAHAPRGQRVTRQTVGLAVYHSIALLEKKLDIVGDRRGHEVLPFDKIPLIYEKTAGGLGDPYNPWGTGLAPGSALPNILHPKDPQVAAGFGPISRALRQRKVLRGPLPAAALDEAYIELPPDFDWNYFQAAPPDQQLPSLVGNEWIVLEGMHPALPRIASRLPSLRPIATLFGVDPAKPDSVQTVQCRLDIVRIDADNLTCSVVARAVVPIENEQALPSMRVVAAVETEEIRYEHLLAPPEKNAQSLRNTVPLAQGKKRAVEHDTMVLADQPAAKQALPFGGKVYEIEDNPTIDMDIASHHEEGSKPATPFPAPGPKRASASRRAPLPGAPWSVERARPVKSPRSWEGTFSEATTAPVDEPTRKFVKPDAAAFVETPPMPVIPPAPIPAPPPIPKAPPVVHTTPSTAEVPAVPKAPVEPPKELWAKTGNELPIVTEKAPPPRMPAKPAVNKAIYGGFGPAKKKT